MTESTPETIAFREAIRAHRDELDATLLRYGATNARLFGSVARGDATSVSDIDIMVDLDPGAGRMLLRLGGLTESFRRILGSPVDVVTPALLKGRVASTALSDAIAL